MDEILKKYPDPIARFAREVIEANPTHRSFLFHALELIDKEDLVRLVKYIDFCAEKNVDLHYLAQSYLTIVEDTFREQIYFMKNQRYRHSSFADIANDVYFNDEYMKRYMYGLALTSFLWPNHTRIRQFFDRTIPTRKTGAYLEVGPGHGYYFMQAMNNTCFEEFTGLDISQTSINMTRDIIDYFCPEKQNSYSLLCCDFLDNDLPSESFDALVMGEVLEHVEEPGRFMDELHRLSRKDAYVYVTTCINAPAIDHIYLFTHPEELEILFRDCGFSMSEACILPYEGKTLQESLTQRLSINVAYVLKKQV